jgi:DNA uptake protein ComE-like DNA-binding protein
MVGEEDPRAPGGESSAPPPVGAPPVPDEAPKPPDGLSRSERRKLARAEKRRRREQEKQRRREERERRKLQRAAGKTRDEDGEAPAGSGSPEVATAVSPAAAEPTPAAEAAGAEPAGPSEGLNAATERLEQAEQADDEAGFAHELRATDELIRRRRARDREIQSELERTEVSLEASRERTERAIEEARARLEQIEQQAGEAEERAVRAERLAEMRAEEAERERRLREVMERINDAERRVREAEARARQAVVDVKGEAGAETPPRPVIPIDDPEPVELLVAQSPDVVAPREESRAPGGDESPAEESLDLNAASFAQLRSAGMSVTQAGRVLAHREHSGSFSTVDQLAELPGFGHDLVEALRSRMRV